MVLAGDATELVIGDNAQHVEGLGVPPARAARQAERSPGPRLRLKGVRGGPWGRRRRGEPAGRDQRQVGSPD